MQLCFHSSTRKILREELTCPSILTRFFFLSFFQSDFCFREWLDSKRNGIRFTVAAYFHVLFYSTLSRYSLEYSSSESVVTQLLSSYSLLENLSAIHIPQFRFTFNHLVTRDCGGGGD